MAFIVCVFCDEPEKLPADHLCQPECHEDGAHLDFCATCRARSIIYWTVVQKSKHIKIEGD